MPTAPGPESEAEMELESELESEPKLTNTLNDQVQLEDDEQAATGKRCDQLSWRRGRSGQVEFESQGGDYRAVQQTVWTLILQVSSMYEP